MQNKFWLILVVVLAGMIGLFALTGSDKSTSAFETYDPDVIQLTDHIDGLDTTPTTQEELDAALADKVVILEYADFQCPACASFFVTTEYIKTDYAGQVVHVFRHFPLTSIHPDAMAAHRASEAAANQGIFWDMHDALYLRQQEWAGRSNVPSVLSSYASEFNMDIEQYEIDVASTDVFDRINVDISSARPLNINSTPTVFVDGERVDVPSQENLSALIDAALAEKES